LTVTQQAGPVTVTLPLATLLMVAALALLTKLAAKAAAASPIGYLFTVLVPQWMMAETTADAALHGDAIQQPSPRGCVQRKPFLTDHHQCDVRL
jgi:hypothetical protein